MTYAPSPDFYGTDSFTYTVTDGNASDTATVTVTVSPVNDAPVAVADTATVAEDDVGDAGRRPGERHRRRQPERSGERGSDGERHDAGSHGTVTIAGDGLSVSYTPAADYNGPDSFTYTITDGQATLDRHRVDHGDRGQRRPGGDG